MKHIKFISSFIFLSAIFYSCGILEQDAHSGMHIYDDPNKFSGTDIYFYDIDKKIFLKIAEGANAQFVPNSDLVVYSQGTNPMYGSTAGIHCVKTDGAEDKSLVAKTQDFYISSQAPIVSPPGNKILFLGSGGYYLVNVDGSSLTKVQLTNIRITAFADFSSDGKKILFRSDKGLVVMNVDTQIFSIISSVENIDIYFQDFHPKFSYDAKSIIYSYQSSKQLIIGKIDLANGENKILYFPSEKYIDYSGTVHMCILPDDKIVFEDTGLLRIYYFDAKNGIPIYYFESPFGTGNPIIANERIINGNEIFYKAGSSLYLFNLETKVSTQYSLPVIPSGMSNWIDYSSDLKNFLCYKLLQ